MKHKSVPNDGHRSHTIDDDYDVNAGNNASEPLKFQNTTSKPSEKSEGLELVVGAMAGGGLGILASNHFKNGEIKEKDEVIKDRDNTIETANLEITALNEKVKDLTFQLKTASDVIASFDDDHKTTNKIWFGQRVIFDYLPFAGVNPELFSDGTASHRPSSGLMFYYGTVLPIARLVSHIEHLALSIDQEEGVPSKRKTLPYSYGAVNNMIDRQMRRALFNAHSWHSSVHASRKQRYYPKVYDYAALKMRQGKVFLYQSLIDVESEPITTTVLSSLGNPAQPTPGLVTYNHFNQWMTNLRQRKFGAYEPTQSYIHPHTRNNITDRVAVYDTANYLIASPTFFSMIRNIFAASTMNEENPEQVTDTLVEMLQGMTALDVISLLPRKYAELFEVVCPDVNGLSIVVYSSYDRGIYAPDYVSTLAYGLLDSEGKPISLRGKVAAIINLFKTSYPWLLK